MTQPIGSQQSDIIPAKSGGTTGSTPAKKHCVLFVDDNQAFLDTISKLYAVLGKGSCETKCATAVAQVFQHFRTEYG